METFESFEKYDFENDQAFQQGLTLLPKSDDPDFMLKTKHFYYSKYVAQFDLQEYKQYKQQPKKLSFQEIMEKVSKGEEIPGIRQIPLVLQESKAEAVMEPIKKPWEL
ncbi:hypothetical protein EDD86DRAFT_103222 [Gorgonomyces haynaldii]|nr:hypothetical protein EDD86DRAFT_103222 [Gorgonomyces haynaldii]